MAGVTYMKNTSFIQAGKSIAFSASSLLGPSKSVKCIVDDDGQFEITANALKLLRAIKVEHPVISIIHDACKGLHNTFGTCCSTLVFMIGSWLESLDTLMQEGIPVPVINHLFDEAVDYCIQEAFKSSIYLDELTRPMTGRISDPQIKIVPARTTGFSKDAVVQKPDKATLSQGSSISNHRSQPSNFISGFQSRTSAFDKSPRTVFSSRYSRHLTEDAVTQCEEDRLLAISASIARICHGVARNDANVEQILLKVTEVIRNRQNGFIEIRDLDLCLDDIFIEICDGKPEAQSSVFEGICVADVVDDLRNTLSPIEKKPVKVGLIDFDQMLYCKKRGKSSDDTNRSDSFKKKLHQLEISCIIYRGEDKEFLDTCHAVGLLALKVSTLRHLKALSLATMNPIVSSIYHLESSDIGLPIVLSLKHFTDESLRQRRAKKRLKSVISLQFPGCSQRFITILVCGTIPVVTSLLEERLTSSLWRLRNLLKEKKCIHGGGGIERKCISQLKEHAERSQRATSNNRSSLPRFLVNELNIYRPIVFTELSKGLERYCSNISRNIAEAGATKATAIDDLGSKCEAWKRAINVVNVISRIDMVVTNGVE
ncbi:Bardet-Biedl syndrome 12 protein homolog [Rhopilema esculentum]|uniref:Bardet-Biedl syndrome 12 protein homolog n=1 Tax=Rhopilema esculentum TaxID=499914 RepID=UPI0031DC1C46|eukprot:gene14454-5516_t